jgi:sulfite reductase alpha subunit-like flavoprotein
VELLKGKFPDQFEQEGILSIDKVENAILGERVDNLVVYRRRNQNFRLPEDTSVPLIMVGPGTGVAPFVGFLQHRQSQKENSTLEIGQNFLYFGCRNREKDFLYEKELSSLSESGILTKLYVSFSRDEGQDGIKYVQDWMLKNQEEIVSVLDDRGYFYVCGDARNMAKNVREALITCLQNVKGIESKEAFGFVAELVSSKRYLQDVWA